MKSKFEQLRDLLTKEEWDNFLANLQLPESHYDNYSIPDIIASAFCWQESTQGNDYWDKIWERLHNNLPVPETFQAAPESPTKSRTHILEELAVACQQWADNPTTGNEQRIEEVLANLENA